MTEPRAGATGSPPAGPQRAPAAPKLFDPEFVRSLDGLQVMARRVLAGRYAGDRRSPQKGQSVEFADFREYVRGDDLRLVDWKAYGRLEKLFIKLFLEEQDLAVTVLVDNSRSMDWGEPAKSVLARRLAGGLAYLALAKGDQVTVAACDTGLRALGPLRGRPGVWRVFEFLEQLEPGGETDLNAALQRLPRRRSGVTIVISDLLSPAGYEEGLKHLQLLGQDVTLIRILSPDERAPDLAGDLRLLDIETGHGEEITVTPWLLEQYQAALAAHTEAAREFCARRGIAWLDLDSTADARGVLVKALGVLGVVSA